MKNSILYIFFSLIWSAGLVHGITRFVQPGDVLQDVIDASSSGDVIAIVKSPCGTGNIQGKDLTLRGVNNVMPVIGILDINNSKVNLLKVQVGELNVSESSGQKSHLFAHACDLLGSIENNASTTRLQYCKVYRLKIHKQAEVVGCEFNGNQNSGIGITVMATGRATINNNRIYDYSGSGVATGNAIGIKVDNGGVADILNNLIHDCYDSADNRNKIIGTGVWVLPSGVSTIRGNIITRCGVSTGSSNRQECALINAPASAVIRNNLLSTASFVAVNNIASHKIVGGAQSFDDINSDPLFTDFTNGDFTLATDSPAIDAGPPDAQYKDHNGSRNDIGMFGGHNFIPDGRTTNKPIVLGLDVAPIAVPTGGTVTIESTGATVK